MAAVSNRALVEMPVGLPAEVGEALFEGLPDALIIVDEALNIARTNEAGREMLGADPKSIGLLKAKNLAKACREACRLPGTSHVASIKGKSAQWLEVSASELQAGFLIRIRDVSKLHAAEQAIRHRDERARLVVKATNDIIWWADPAKGFVEPQESWEEFTGQGFDDYKHWGHVNAIHPDDRQRVQDAWAAASAEKRVCQCEYRVYCPSKGEYRHCMAKGVPVLGSDGEIHEWVGTLTDIHDLKSAQAELRELNKKLESRVQERTAALEATLKELEGFTYTTSHDLRQSLRGIVANAELLRSTSDNLNAEQSDILERLTFNGRKLARLVDDLLNLTRITRKPMELRETDVSSIAAEIARRRTTPSIDFHIQDGMTAFADASLLRIALEQVIDNAVKFSPSGGEIRVGHDGGVFHVKDSGIGVNPNYLHKIFQPFERLHHDEEFPGTGIGLALVQRIVHRHGGTLRAEGLPGKGSTFYFSLGPADAEPVTK